MKKEIEKRIEIQNLTSKASEVATDPKTIYGDSIPAAFLQTIRISVKGVIMMNDSIIIVPVRIQHLNSGNKDLYKVTIDRATMTKISVLPGEEQKPFRLF